MPLTQRDDPDLLCQRDKAGQAGALRFCGSLGDGVDAKVLADDRKLVEEFARFVSEYQKVLHSYKFPLHDLGPLPPYRRHKCW